MNEKINSCPRCGGVGTIIVIDGLYAVECQHCWFFWAPKFETDTEAIEYWNAGAKDGYNLVHPSRGREIARKSLKESEP